MGLNRWAWAGAATTATVTGWAMLSRPVEDRLSDLHVYLGAVSSPSLYDFIRGNAPFTYPPFAALLFRPLATFPLPTVQFLWTAATIATVAAIAIMTTRSRAGTTPPTPTQPPRDHTPVTPPTPTQPPRGHTPAPTPAARVRTVVTARTIHPLAAARPRSQTTDLSGWLALALMLSAPFSSNMRFGQVSIFLAALALTDLLVLRNTRYCGVLIGLTAAVKLTPLIFIPLLFLSARCRAALTAIATFAACTALAAITLPGDTLRYWTAEIFQVNRLGNITSAGNQSLNGMLLRLAVPEEPRTLLTLTIGGTIAALALWRAARAARSDDWLTATIITGAAAIVLSPVSWTHHQIWLVLAVLLPLPTRRAQTTWTAVVLTTMLLPITALDNPLWTNARLLLAVVIATLIPFRTTPTKPRFLQALRRPNPSPGRPYRRHQETLLTRLM